MKSKILITGGSGLIGSHLSEMLLSKGYEVVHLSRYGNKASKFQTFTWDINKGFIEESAFENVKYIIHLAGAGIADKRWSDKRKRTLTSSRVDSANLIYTWLKSGDHHIEAFITASAIGVYGLDTGGILQSEDRIQVGDDFLATLTKKWEAAADQFTDLGIRVIKLRIGLVLSEKGGLLGKLVPLAKLGLSSAFGTGSQFMSWIHIDDLANIFMKAIENHEFRGVYNAVASNPVTNKEFLKQLSEALKKPYFLPNTPKFVLNLVLGELASAVTGGNKVSAKKLEGGGFNFQFPEISEALKDLLKK